MRSIVSVIIPTRNRLAFLQEAVASVSAQDYAERELIVVDDVSEDGTWHWLSSLGDPGIKVFRLPQHAERSAARNYGLSQARGEFVLFLDDDDRLIAGALGNLAEGVKRAPAAMAVVGNRMYFDQAGRRYTYPHPRRAVVCKVWRELLFGWAPQVSQCIIRKSAIMDAGGWDPAMSYAEDYELWLRMVSAESEVVVLPRLVSEYRVHPGQTAPRRLRLRSKRLAFMQRLPSSLQGSANKTLRAARLEHAASRALAGRQHVKASKLYAAAAVESLEMLFSPLLGYRLLRALGKSLLGAAMGPAAYMGVRQVSVWPATRGEHSGAGVSGQGRSAERITKPVR